MDHFWLETPMHWTDETDTEITEPKDRPNLLKEQMDDLMRNYGERMGKKALKSGLIWIRSDEGQALGLVCLMQLLLRKENGGLISHIDSNEMIQSAVASLGPKQRRVFQKASAEEIVTQLLPQYDLICMVSNLSVAFRRKGLGKQLCQHAETTAKETWGHDRLHLKVETTNTAAMALYEQVGYSAELSISSDPAVRIDKRNGAFTVQESVSTILMSKDL